MSHSIAVMLLAMVLALSFEGCDKDDDGVTKPVVPPPNIAGTYTGTWYIDVLRKSDGFHKLFSCRLSLTLWQAETETGAARLSGWASVGDLVGDRCAPESYDLSGIVAAGGVTELTTNGPAPPEGPCPGGVGVRMSGQYSLLYGWHSLAARGVTHVVCPQYGEHQITYSISAVR